MRINANLMQINANRNKKFVIFVIVAIIFVVLFLRYFYRSPKRHYSDFKVYYATAKLFAEKQNIYSRPKQSIPPFKYSPMFAMLLAPLSFFSERAASLIFFTINFAFLIVVFIFSKKLIKNGKNKKNGNSTLFFKNGDRPLFLLYILPALFSLRFILLTLDCGQVGIIMLALILLALYFLREKKDVIAAAFLGLSIMFKYIPAIFLPYLVFKKRIKAFVFILIFIMLYSLIPAAYVGVDTEIDYIKNWIPFITGTSFHQETWYDTKNQSLFSSVLRYFTKDSPHKISVANLTFNQGLIISSIIGIMIYLLIIFPRNNYNPPNPVEYSLLLIFMTLFNPNAWMHNFVILIFVYMTLFHYLIKINFKNKNILILIALSFILTTLASDSFVGDRLENLFEQLSSVTIGTLFLAFLLFRLKFSRWGNR